MENMVTDQNFWSGKNVFLTGHTGFKGGWLSLWLQSLGANVTGYSLAPPTTPSLFNVADIASGMQSQIADVRDAERLITAVKSAKPDVVFHLAAQPLVRYSYINPVETYSTNVMGTVNLLEAIRQTDRVRAVVVVTSDKCYQNKEWVWGYREDEAMGGYDPYSNSKGCSELVISSYRDSFFNPAEYERHGVALASGRAGNVIGGGDWAQDRLIPDILKAIEAARPVLIRSPHSIRPWQHVLEPLSGYILLAENLFKYGDAYAEAWNFGPNDVDAKPVQAIVERLTSAWGDGAKWQLDQGEHPHEAHYLKLDCSKAKMRMGWTPSWSIDNALDKIVDWHKAYLTRENMRDKTLGQINDYRSNLDWGNAHE